MSIIKVENLSKTFRLPRESRSTLKQHFVGIFRKQQYERFDALKDVSLEIEKGEFLGVIGRNGSGKSTLLKILAGIYQPSEGTVEVNGKISPFLELGVGFQPELSAYDNIYLYGTLLGLKHKEIGAKIGEIIKFSELEKFIDQKLKNFSSGMQVRLAFATAIQANADIYLIDEVLAVGDANFQQKCFDVFRRLKKEEKTIIFVSHDLASMEKFSDRVVIIDSSKINFDGDTQEGIKYYYKLING